MDKTGTQNDSSLQTRCSPVTDSPLRSDIHSHDSFWSNPDQSPQSWQNRDPEKPPGHLLPARSG